MYKSSAKRRRALLTRSNVRGWVAGVAAAVALASSVVYLVREAEFMVHETGPAEGSLIVNINTATKRELISVPGIGASRAAQIIAGRPYETVDDLEKIAGIGGKTLESLRPFVTVEGETRKRE